jgi:hypothetical protein
MLFMNLYIFSYFDMMAIPGQSMKRALYRIQFAIINEQLTIGQWTMPGLSLPPGLICGETGLKTLTGQFTFLLSAPKNRKRFAPFPVCHRTVILSERSYFDMYLFGHEIVDGL